MFVSLIKKLYRDRRAATAVALAIMLVPLLVAAGAAVDFSRIASARTLLQAAIDGAAVAGGGEWQMSESSSNAYNVTSNEFSNTGAQLSNFVSISSPTIKLACTGTSTECGGTASYSTTLFANCSTGSEYCVTVSATATLKSSLLGWLIPVNFLSASSTASVGYGPNNFGGGNIPPSAGFGSAGDISGVYAYAVPMDGSGNSANYSELPTPNSYCKSATGPLQYLAASTSETGVTACNYLYVNDSLGQGGTGGSITLQTNQPIAFAFVNYTGANGYTSSNYSTSTTNILVSTTSSSSGYDYYPAGYTTPATPPVTCTKHQKNCTPSQGSPGTVLYGNCPAHTLYGSLDSNNGAPQSDSLNEYSSAYEVLGKPTTYKTNHVLTPFVTTLVVSQNLGGVTYYVKAVCPNYPISGTEISAPVSSNYSNIVGNQYFAGANTFSTWFPTGLPNEVAFTDNSAACAIDNCNSATDIFPPAIGGCTPATNAADGGITPASSDPWWNWGSSNISSSLCSQQQVPAYSNCALLIQPLGTSVPVNSSNSALLPDYYNTITDTSGNVIALDPVYDNTTYVDRLTGVQITNTDSAGYVPSSSSSTLISNSTTIHGGGTVTPYAGSQYVGDKLVVQQPSNGDHTPPLWTSHQCYNPTVAIQDKGYKLYTGGTDILGYNADGTAIDPVANPQLGAVPCNTNPPNTYALYWNDLGTYYNDDLGYWNALEAFTCSVPASTNAGGGASLLSG
ncbi:MAG: Tad domain-containing protein [Acidocella sp.]|nr:Tad domain-containing protein [Acidocella sp.]